MYFPIIEKNIMAQPYDAETWQEKRAFEETNLHMLNYNVLSDITFLMGTNKEEVKAHKFMLASRSPVFYAMFCGPMSETSSTIEIPDIEPEIMSTVLRFIYTEDCGVNGESVMALLYAAKKYNIKRLGQKCIAFLSEQQISSDSVCAIFAQADKFCEMELKQKCFTFILSNGKQVLQTEGFKTLPKELLTEILESDEMTATEVDIYKSCKTWATYQLCKANESRDISHLDMRNILGDLIYLIRFPIMTIYMFTNKVSHDDILSSDEKVSIFQFIAAWSKGEQFRFSVKPRACFNKTLLITRSPGNGHGWGQYGDVDAIDFNVSKTAMFHGFGLFAPCSIGSVKGTVSLLRDKSVILNKVVDITYSPVKCYEEVEFDEGVSLVPGNRYTIKVVLKGHPACCGLNGLNEVTVGDFSITFSDSDRTNHTSAHQRKVPFKILGIK